MVSAKQRLMRLAFWALFAPAEWVSSGGAARRRNFGAISRGAQPQDLALLLEWNGCHESGALPRWGRTFWLAYLPGCFSRK